MNWLNQLGHNGISKLVNQVWDFGIKKVSRIPYCPASPIGMLPLYLIFKEQNLNLDWIPNKTLVGQKFIILKKGSTSNVIRFKQLKAYFQLFVSKLTNL